MGHTIFNDIIQEKTTPKITAILKDENDNAISSASLDSLKLTLISISDAPVYSVINGRNQQNVLNLNGVTVDNLGNLSWRLSVDDTTLMDSHLDKEVHQAIFEFTYDSGNGAGKHIIEMTISNVPRL